MISLSQVQCVGLSCLHLCAPLDCAHGSVSATVDSLVPRASVGLPLRPCAPEWCADPCHQHIVRAVGSLCITSLASSRCDPVWRSFATISLHTRRYALQGRSLFVAPYQSGSPPLNTGLYDWNLGALAQSHASRESLEPLPPARMVPPMLCHPSLVWVPVPSIQCVLAPNHRALLHLPY